MLLKEREFFEYIKCPLRYQLIAKGNQLEDNKTFKQLCYEAINSYLNARQMGMTANANTLKRKWDSLAKENPMILNPKKTLEGWGLIYRTLEYIELSNIKFIGINTSYSLELPGTGVCLNGVFNPLIDRGTHIEIFVPCFDKQMPERSEIDIKLKHTIESLAIKNMYDKDVEITYYVPSQNKTIETLRSTNDFHRLESIAKSVGQGIQMNIIYPRETFMCSSCVAKPICKSWTGKEEV